MEKSMNRVDEYKLNAKKAYEFACGLREVITGKSKTRRIYGKKPGRPTFKPSKINELSSEEQKIFVQGAEYAYRYSVKLVGKRLDQQVEEDLLNKVESPEDIKFAIEYCKFFNLALPTSLHNRILMQTAMPIDKSNMRWSDRYAIEKSERKQKKYLKELNQHKKSFAMMLNGIIKENKLSERDTIGDLLKLIN